MKQSISTDPDPSDHHTPLSKLIFQTLAKNSPERLRFDDFMDLALYHNQHGYYSSSIGRKIGREGDFYTSVSVGDTFGRLLSFSVEQEWPPEHPLTLVEQGGHDARLARDIIDAFKDRKSRLFKELKYFIVEPSDQKRADLRQIAKADGYSDTLYPVESLQEIKAERGLFLCNELLDAFPVRRFSRTEDSWWELFVVAGETQGQLTEKWFPVGSTDAEDPGFEQFLKLVEPYYRDWQDGYETEFCEATNHWVEACSQLFPLEGYWWIIDYGLNAERYFETTRRTGTLKCYSTHRTHEVPTWKPGECDISSHVNFTHLVGEAELRGLTLESIEDQSRFLTLAGKDWLMSLEGEVPSQQDSARLRQFQTLTHPGMMGRNFQIVKLKRAKPTA